MEEILRNIVKEQNRVLLTNVATKFELDPEAILKKYWTPSFYAVQMDASNVYPIIQQTDARRPCRELRADPPTAPK